MSNAKKNPVIESIKLLGTGQAIPAGYTWLVMLVGLVASTAMNSLNTLSPVLGIASSLVVLAVIPYLIDTLFAWYWEVDSRKKGLVSESEFAQGRFEV